MKLFFIILSNAQDKEYFNIEIIFLFPHCVQLSLKMEKGGGDKWNVYSSWELIIKHPIRNQRLYEKMLQ